MPARVTCPTALALTAEAAGALEAAFPNVDWQAVWSVIQKYGLPALLELLKALKVLL